MASKVYFTNLRVTSGSLLDKACVDLVNSVPAMPGSVIEGMAAGADKIRAVHPDIDWEPQLSHAVKMGLGSIEYELIGK